MAHSEEWWLCRHFHNITCEILLFYVDRNVFWLYRLCQSKHGNRPAHGPEKSPLFKYIHKDSKEGRTSLFNLNSSIHMVERQFYNLTFQSTEQSAQSQELFPFRR